VPPPRQSLVFTKKAEQHEYLINDVYVYSTPTLGEDKPSPNPITFHSVGPRGNALTVEPPTMT
jgi:hypothetical protein